MTIEQFDKVSALIMREDDFATARSSAEESWAKKNSKKKSNED